MAQAKAAAGERNVLVHGAYTAQRALEAGVLDELQIHHPGPIRWRTPAVRATAVPAAI
jgi:dihydrofolate reductase